MADEDNSGAPDAFARAGCLLLSKHFRQYVGAPAPLLAFGPLELALAARLARCGRGERDLVTLFESLRYKRPDLRALLTCIFSSSIARRTF